MKGKRGEGRGGGYSPWKDISQKPPKKLAEVWTAEETHIVEVYVGTTIMCQDKIPNRVSPLYGVCVVVKGG